MANQQQQRQHSTASVLRESSDAAAGALQKVECAERAGGAAAAMPMESGALEKSAHVQQCVAAAMRMQGP